MSIQEFNILTKVNKKKFFDIPILSKPVPTAGDYETGILIRYFCRKINDKRSQVFEVDAAQYTKFLNNNFWLNVKIEWNIANHSRVSNKEEAHRFNNEEINKARKVISNIHTVLPNTLEYYDSGERTTVQRISD